MPPFAPGYATPYTGDVALLDIDLGMRSSNRQYINWRPVGTYLEAARTDTWGLEAGGLVFSLHHKHPVNDIIKETGIKRRAYHVRCTYNGVTNWYRVMKRTEAVEGRSRKITYECVDYKYWLSRWLAWVNPLFPPEIQIGLTGKQDLMFGPPDPVFKYYLAKNFIRLDRPVYCSLPIHWPTSWTQPNVGDINSVDDLLDLIFDATDDIVALAARFTYGNELFEQTCTALEMGVSMGMWDGHGESPEVFNTDSLASLQSIIDYSSDHFLDLSQLLKPVNNGLFSFHADRACYVFDTAQKRDNRKVQWRTDGTQISGWTHQEMHGDATDAIVGGKSPSMVNELIEIGANLAIAAIIAVIATIPGAAGVAGLSIGVGDLFDDIFFAYQRFWDQDLEDDIGSDDAFAEIFADNTAAWSIDGYSVGQNALKEHGGTEELEIRTIDFGGTGRGITYGADDGTARRFRMGDTMHFWDDGNLVEQYASKFVVADKPGEMRRGALTLGSDKRLKGPTDRALAGINKAAAALNGFANAL